MSQPGPVVVQPEGRKDALELLDHLDPAIGEATSLVGATLTELLRRTLRGSVVRIGDEMHGYVADKVDTVIAERTPGLEQLAAEVAEHAARTAATEVATEEVHALEQRTRAGDLELDGKIGQTARAAEQQTRESAASLTAQIKESEQRTAEAAATLTAQIRESEQRGRAALREQVETLVDRSHERSERLKARLVEQDNLIADLGRQLADLGRQLEGLTDRVAELEKPRGLRALWLRLFGRRKTKPAEPVAAA
jgi:DNA anti-recombination protein RmuC